MNQFSYKGQSPKIKESCFLASGCQLIGDLELEENVNIWFNTVIRADVAPIKIAKDTNIQDLSMLHVTEGHPLLIGENNTIGHSVTLHSCQIGNNNLIGMGATLLDDSKIGNFSIVAAGSVVSPNKTFPDRSMIMGIPARAIRELTDQEIDMLYNHYKNYLNYSNDYKNQSQKLSL